MVTGKTALSRTWGCLLLLALFLAINLDTHTHFALFLAFVPLSTNEVQWRGARGEVKIKRPPMWAVAIFLIILRQSENKAAHV
jgi:hypothetical protein